jgi:Protein of unknown function (DUF2909)
MIKFLLISIFLLIIASLGLALFHLVKPKGDGTSEKMAKALTFRIGLSLFLFIFVFILIATGIVKPHGIGNRIFQQKSLAADHAK